ncbi:MAG TPA: hypothetical protein VIL00_13185 [Pseudonocardiaceae bacterium]
MTSLRKTTAALGLALMSTLGALAVAPTAEASGYKMTHAQATARLSAAGITWSSSGGCSDRNKPNCTSFEQINSGTIDGIITLKQASGCAINITGGTETGHASGTYSHWNGYKVDISLNSCINSYIRNSFTRIVPPSFGSEQYRSAAGNIYTLESNHWDILYY